MQQQLSDYYSIYEVDDFAIATKDATIIENLLNSINKHLKQKLKCQGSLYHFNRLEIEQTKHFAVEQKITSSNSTSILGPL